MKKNLFHRGLSLVLAFCMPFSLALGCTGCGGTGGGFGASAASMFLRKTEGTVAVSDAGGADVAPAENLGLYSGYTVGTEEESYAWIDLDKVKLAKLNQNSAVGIVKDGKNLSIDVTSGSLFFNVTEPLADDETMEISTSSLMVGIRGTCGWVAQKSVGLLEGTVTVTAGKESATISAGERARLTEDGALEVSALAYDAIPAFVAQELLSDEALQQTVLEASGLLIPTTYEELVSALKQKYPEQEIVYSEVIDFEADGNPELLVIQNSVADDGSFSMGIYRMETEGPECLAGAGVGINGSVTPTRYACSLAERDGRMYVCCQCEATSGTEMYFSDFYVGSVAAQDGGCEDWGRTDYFTGYGESRESGRMNAVIHNEKGFVDNSDLNQYEPYPVDLNKYTLVRELYVTTPSS